MYRKIADDLREKIESGELAPGGQLPTEQELREQYGNASRNTIRDAIRWLIMCRLVSTQPGRGTFVTEAFQPFIVPLQRPLESETFLKTVMEQGGDARVTKHPKVEVQTAGNDVARELRLDKGSMVVSRHQERFIDGNPSSLQTSFYPMDFVDDGAKDLLVAQDIETGVTNYLAQKLGISQAGWRDRLTVRPPNPGEVRFFGVPDDGTVLMVVTHRTAYAEGHKPIRYTVTVYSADRNQFVIEQGDVPDLSELIGKL